MSDYAFSDQFKDEPMSRYLFAFLFLSSQALAQSALDNCAEQFIDGDTANAPTLFNSAPTEPFMSNQHLSTTSL